MYIYKFLFKSEYLLRATQIIFTSGAYSLSNLISIRWMYKHYWMSSFKRDTPRIYLHYYYNGLILPL